jgi:hypothetical protein
VITGYVDNIDIIGGDYGPGDSCDVEPGVKIYEAVGGGINYAGTDILIRGVYFHDFIDANCGGFHTECVLVTAGERVTIEDSTFWNCDSTGAIYATEFNSADPNGYCLDLVIQNNFFYVGDPGEGGSGPVLQDDCEILFRNNTMAEGADLSMERWDLDAAAGDGCGNGAGGNCDVQVYGNYGDTGECAPRANFDFEDNVWLDINCGGTDLQVADMEVVDGDENLHLVTGSDAIDNGYATSYPATDIDGDNRYLGSGPDAGADEKE